MAITTYTVKRGDSLWKISKNYGSSIAGNNINAKIDTLVRLNGIKNRNLIYVGQVLKLSESGSTSSYPTPAQSSPTPAPSGQTQPVVDSFGLQSANETSGKNRAMYAAWAFSRDHTKNFKYRWTQYKNGNWVLGEEGETTAADSIYCYDEYTADTSSTRVRFQVLPISDTYKSGDNDVPYWTGAQWSAVKEYDFSNNPPLTPGTPTVTIDDLTLVISISNIDASDLDATSVKFNIVKDNSASIHTSSPIAINTASNYVSYRYKVTEGSTYTVRACSVNSRGQTSGWSDFSNEVGTKPSAPSGITT